MSENTIKLTPEERDVLQKMSIKQLQILAHLIESKEMEVEISIVNTLLENDKNWFLQYDESDEKKLMRKHAAFRGAYILWFKYLRIAKSSSHELAKRDEERKKRKQPHV